MSRVAQGLLPSTAVLELTYACNHACVFCSCPWYASGYDVLPEMPVEAWMAALSALAAQGVTEFAFTGGEPLLKEGWREIVEFAASLEVLRPDAAPGRPRRPGLHLISNGKATTAGDLRFLAELGVHLMLSLPGIESYAEHTGGGDPDRVLALFEDAARIGLSTTVGVTITRRNLQETYTTIGHAFLAGAGSLLLNRFLPGGRGLANRHELSLDASGVELMLDEADAALRAAGRDGHVGTELPLCTFDPARLDRLRVGTRCGAANDFFVVDPSGWLRVCNHSPVRLVHWTQADTVWRQPRWRRFALHEHAGPACAGCSSLPRCDAGCPEASEIVARLGELGPPLHHCNPC